MVDNNGVFQLPTEKTVNVPNTKICCAQSDSYASYPDLIIMLYACIEMPPSTIYVFN